VLADIPGLLEGAHAGRGLGLEFLRHIERTRVLVFVIDSTSADLAAEYAMLQRELAAYAPALENRPRLVALSKIDLLDDAGIEAARRSLPANDLVVAISAAARRNLPRLVGCIADTIDAARQAAES
jgi:GTP-binding protein